MTRTGTLLATIAILATTACTPDEPADGGTTTPPPTTPAATTSTPAASPPPTPTVTAPTMPPAARKHNAQGAAAFVEYWVEVFNRAATSLDVSQLAEHSAPQCDACRRIIDRLAQVRKDGGTSESPEWRTRLTSSQLLKGDYYVTAEITTSDYRYQASAEAEEGLVKAARYEFIFRLARRDGRWLLARLTEQELPG